MQERNEPAVEHGITTVSPIGDTTQLSPMGDTGTVHVIPGWRRPEWAAKISYDGNTVVFERVAESIPAQLPTMTDDEPTPSNIELSRTDTIRVDGETGTVSVLEGVPHIYVDVETISVPEARKLAAALVELADAVDGAR